MYLRYEYWEDYIYFQKNDKKFRTDLKEAFSMARESFFISNGLEEEDVISIKKDAIFTKRFDSRINKTIWNIINICA